MNAVMAQPRLQCLRRFVRVTRTAHGLHEHDGSAAPAKRRPA
jgi:hypothetical protein